MAPAPHPPLLLASASPRRRRLMHWLGTEFRVTSVDIPEELDRGFGPAALACTIAAEKAVAARQAADPTGEALVIACDTIVVLDDAVLGKPADIDDALRMLRALSGRTHEVVTGVALLPPGERPPATFSVTTPVLMRSLTEETIAEWVERGELLGCAGAYNIESHLATVEDSECFQNVAGLPLCHLWRALDSAAFGEVAALRSPCAACEEARGVVCRLGRELSEEG